MPDPVPVFRGWGAAKGGNSGKEFERGAITFSDGKALLEGFFGFGPLLVAVKIEGKGVGFAQLGGGGVELANGRKEFINADGLCFSIDGEEIDLTGFDIDFGQSVAVLVHDEIGTVDFVDPFQTGGDVDGVADDGEGFGGGGADGADQGVPSGQGHTDMKFGGIAAQTSDLRNLSLNFGKGRAHFEAGEAGIPCVGFPLRKRASPKSHDGVPDKLVHDAVVISNTLGGGGEVVVEKADGVVRGELLPDPAEAGDIGKEDGDFPALGRLAEFPSFRVDDIGHDTGIEKVTKRFAKSFFRFELLDHGVERGGQVTDLILGSDWKGIGVFAVGGLMKGGGESAKSGLQSASDTKKDEESQPAGKGKENQVGPNDMVNILVRFQD